MIDLIIPEITSTVIDMQLFTPLFITIYLSCLYWVNFCILYLMMRMMKNSINRIIGMNRELFQNSFRFRDFFAVNMWVINPLISVISLFFRDLNYEITHLSIFMLNNFITIFQSLVITFICCGFGIMCKLINSDYFNPIQIKEYIDDELLY
jgi:hypothetical protein